jgi:hypothetical protein
MVVVIAVCDVPNNKEQRTKNKEEQRTATK